MDGAIAALAHIEFRRSLRTRPCLRPPMLGSPVIGRRLWQRRPRSTQGRAPSTVPEPRHGHINCLGTQGLVGKVLKKAIPRKRAGHQHRSVDGNNHQCCRSPSLNGERRPANMNKGSAQYANMPGSRSATVPATGWNQVKKAKGRRSDCPKTDQIFLGRRSAGPEPTACIARWTRRSRPKQAPKIIARHDS